MSITKVYVVNDNSVIEYDASCTEVVGVFTTLENAKKALKSRAETYKDVEDEWHDESSDEDWTIEDDHYEIYMDGYYAQNHVEITIEEKELDDPLFLS